MPLFEPFLHSNNGWRVLKSFGLIQHSMLNPLLSPTFKLAEAATATAPVPPKLNAWPTAPGLKPTPTPTVAGLFPITSSPLPSAAHQLTRPAGGVTHAPNTWLGIIDTTHANANTAIMYRFINGLSSFIANTVNWSWDFPFRVFPGG
jgi:hypothetical protein